MAFSSPNQQSKDGGQVCGDASHHQKTLEFDLITEQFQECFYQPTMEV